MYFHFFAPLCFSGTTYNIWYGKWAGGDREDHSKHLSQTRCDIARDAGYTRGIDSSAGPSGSSSNSYICLPFAKGCCPRGSDCPFLHRLPRLPEPSGPDGKRAADAAIVDTLDQGKDIFGREKLGDDRDDMGGAGSIQRVNRTLYIGKIHEEEEDLRRSSGGGGGGFNGGADGPQWRDGGKTVKGGKSLTQARRDASGSQRNKGNSKNGQDRDAADRPSMSATEQVLRRHFSEWGPLERIRVLHHRGCGFVTYVYEASAQFAKEAMSNQSLDHGEILNVRWATEDPNPAAQKRSRARMEDVGQKRVQERMTDEQRQFLRARAMLENGELDDGGDEVGESKRLRIEDGNGPVDEDEDEDEDMARLIEENQRNWEQMEQEQQAASAALANGQSSQPTQHAVEAPGIHTGLLSSDALGGLAHLQSLRDNPASAAVPGTAPSSQQKSANAAATKQQSKAPAATGLGGLAAYGSDDEEED